MLKSRFAENLLFLCIFNPHNQSFSFRWERKLIKWLSHKTSGSSQWSKKLLSSENDSKPSECKCIYISVFSRKAIPSFERFYPFRLKFVNKSRKELIMHFGLVSTKNSNEHVKRKGIYMK